MKHKILVVDDEKMNIELVVAFLDKEDYKISYATSGRKALEGLFTKNFDLVLLDINMPKMDGFEVCRRIKADKKTKDIPVIFLTAQNSIEYISEAFEVGGIDYINKPFCGEELKIRVDTQLKLRSSIVELKEKQSKLAQLSITDNLTKIYNYLYFNAQLKLMIKDDSNLWLMHLRVDRLEKFNQIYGNLKGDEILRQISKIIQNSLYSTDILARLYGAHFGVIIPKREFKQIQDIVHVIIKDLKSSNKLPQATTASIAVVACEDGESASDLLKRTNNILEKLQGDGSGLFIIEK
jgi:diguanylate cyclase (GGDEF)-like protein